jgi:hypothetical protein
MSPTTAMLAEALDLAREESRALLEHDVDRADDLSAKRAEILALACASLGRHTGEEDMRCLLLLDKTQKELTVEAEKLLDRLRAQNRQGRKMTAYFNNDRNMNRELKKSFYCDAVS